MTSGVTHGLRFVSCSVSWRTPQFEDGANGWSRRPVALRTVSYPHHREHPAVKLGRRGTHRAAQKGAQAQRAVDVVRFYVVRGDLRGDPLGWAGLDREKSSRET